GLICPLTVQRNTIKFEVPISFLAAIVLFVLVNDVLIQGGEASLLSRLDSGILLILFLGFLFYIYRTTKVSETNPNDNTIKIYKLPVAVGMVMGGLAMLVGGGKLVVDNAIFIAQEFGL